VTYPPIPEGNHGAHDNWGLPGKPMNEREEANARNMSYFWVILSLCIAVAIIGPLALIVLVLTLVAKWTKDA
jgi:hypothetical protein